MQRTVSLVTVMPMALSPMFAILGQDSVNASPTCRGGGVMNVSLKPLASNQQGDASPATAIPLGLNPSTVKRVGSVGASLE